MHRVRALRLIVPPNDCRRVLLRFGRDVSRWADLKAALRAADLDMAQAALSP